MKYVLKTDKAATHCAAAQIKKLLHLIQQHKRGDKIGERFPQTGK